MKYIKVIGIVVAGLLAVFGAYSLVPKGNVAAVIPQPNTNASHYANTIYAGGGITVGGGVFATSTFGTADILAEGEVSPTNLIQYTPNTGDTTLTLPNFLASNGDLPNQGDEDFFYLQNTATTTYKITLAGSATTTMSIATTTAVVTQGETVQIDCIRLGGQPYTGNFASTTCFVY